MKFSIERADILPKINHLSSIVPVKNTMIVLTNFLIEADHLSNILKITATDLEITVRAEIEADIIESGKIAVSAKSFSDIISSFPDNIVYLASAEQELKISCGKSKFSLPCIDPLQFPLIPDEQMENADSMDISLFSKMISSTAFATSNKISRPILNGILWKITKEKQLMAATDSSKIAEFTVTQSSEIEQEQIEKIIPTKAPNFIARIAEDGKAEIKILFKSNKVIFKYGIFTIFSHVIEGKYPDYTRAFPQDNDNKLVIDRADLIKSIKRISLTSSEFDFKIQLDISDEGTFLSSSNTNKEEGREELTTVFSNCSNFGIAFNYRYLLSILNVMSDKNVLFLFKGPNDAILVFNENEKENLASRFLLMPLRIRSTS